MRKLSKNVVLILIVIVVLINAWQLFSNIIWKDQLPAIFGYSQVIVLTGSMEPVISAGDLLIIHREELYQEGDIISYWDNGSLITHRFIKNTADGIITKGDYNNVADRVPVQTDQIAGRVTVIIPGIGNIFMFFRTVPGRLLLLLAVVLFVCFPGQTVRKSERNEH